MKELKSDLVEKLISAARFEEAGDLVDPEENFALGLDCYLKANNYKRAIKFCLDNLRDDEIGTNIRHSLMIAFELKAN